MLLESICALFRIKMFFMPNKIYSFTSDSTEGRLWQTQFKFPFLIKIGSSLLFFQSSSICVESTIFDVVSRERRGDENWPDPP